MDFISWSSTLLKLNGYDATDQHQQANRFLSTYWPWISEQSFGAARPNLIDLAVLEASAAAVNQFCHTTPQTVRNLMSSTIMERHHQLSFGIDRILGDQLGPHHSSIFPQVLPNAIRTDCQEVHNLSVSQRGEAAKVDNFVTNQQENRQKITMVEEQQTNSSRRKRSWSRAVFSNLQRKGLEKRFQLQKYITKPDRRQLAATLGLTDAQVKVWFQNRRMKWRHNKELPPKIEDITRNSSPEQYVESAENIDCTDDDSDSAATHLALPKRNSHNLQLPSLGFANV